MKKTKILAAIAASLLLSGLTDVKAQWTNTGTTEYTTNNVGIGLTAPTANLHISGTNSQPLLNTTLTGIPNDFLRIQNGTSNTTTYIPTIWGNNAEGYTGFEVGGSTSSANDISGYPPVININGRRYDGTGSGSPLLNRTLFEVSNYTVPLFTIGAATGATTIGVSGSTANNLTVNGGATIMGGAVGIGTATPAVNLDVAGVGPALRTSSTVTGANIGIATSDCNGCFGVPNQATTLYSQVNTQFVINSGGMYNGTRADLVFTSGFGNSKTNMTIYGQTGQVAIGTFSSAPNANYLLAINGYGCSVMHHYYCHKQYFSRLCI